MCIFRGGRGISKASKCICVIITIRSTAKAIMRVIVWLTKRQDRMTAVRYYLISARALSRSLRNDLACDGLSIRYHNRRIVRNARGQLVKRAIQRQSEHDRGERGRGRKGAKGVTRREIPIVIIISRREPRSLTAVELPLRVEAQIARNEFLMIILFPPLLPPPTLFFRDDGIYRATLYARASRALGTSLAHSSLIMNGLFIVAAAVAAACPTLSTISLCVPAH